VRRLRGDGEVHRTRLEPARFGTGLPVLDAGMSARLRDLIGARIGRDDMCEAGR